MNVKKVKDMLSSLEAQKDMLEHRINDGFYSDCKVIFSMQLIRIESEIRRLNKIICEQ